MSYLPIEVFDKVIKLINESNSVRTFTSHAKVNKVYHYVIGQVEIQDWGSIQVSYNGQLLGFIRRPENMKLIRKTIDELEERIRLNAINSLMKEVV